MTYGSVAVAIEDQRVGTHPHLQDRDTTSGAGHLGLQEHPSLARVLLTERWEKGTATRNKGIGFGNVEQVQEKSRTSVRRAGMHH